MPNDRILRSFLSQKASQNKVRLIFGARQTGKTTLFQMIGKKNARVIDLQERSQRIRYERDPELLRRQLESSDSNLRHVLIDEIQRVPALLDEIQLMVDRRFPRELTFTLTGSSAKKIQRDSANLLPGRARLYRIMPVTLWEQKRPHAGSLLPAPAPNERPFRLKSLESMLIFGCLPAAWSEEDAFAATLESYAELYLEEEIEREALVRGVGRFGDFLQLSAIESGKPINLTKISKETGIPVSTLQGFYPILEGTFCGFRLPPFSKSERVRVLKAPKFFFFDVGVRNAVARVPLDERMLAATGGHLFEHWLGCELMARTSYLGRSYRLSYWRTIRGYEVDFVLETPNEIIPIEAKFTKNPTERDASGIKGFMKYHPTAKRGFVVCRISHPEKITKGVTAIPWHDI